MALPPYRTDGAEYATSIVMDASTVNQTTVTVVVHAPREREPAILDAVYEHGTDLDFKPFYHKSNDFEYPERQAFTEALIKDFHPHLAAFAHHQRYDSNEDTQQIEALHSAIHVHDRLTAASEQPVVIVDGNEQQARPFVRALSGLREELPEVAHCQRSEYHYPTALLADLVSNYFAHRLDRGEFSTNPDDLPLDVPRAKRDRSPEWGRAVSTLYQDGITYVPAALPPRRGESVRERVNCWYQGAVAPNSGVDRPMSDSLTPVVNALERGGYEELAAVLREL
jgi:hypothetical protein